MNLHPGDIVSCRGARWVVTGHENNHLGVRSLAHLARIEWDRHRKVRVGITVGVGDVELVRIPVFGLGDRVRHSSGWGRVIADGEFTVLLELDDTRHDIAGGGHTLYRDQRVQALRSDLVLLNAKELK